MVDWRNRVVVITGASAGVGRAVARKLARCGASLGLLARRVEGLDGVWREAEAAGASTVTLVADVGDATSVRAAAARVERELGPIGVWINNAMVSVFSPIMAMEPDEFERVTKVTYLGAVYGTLAALECMVPRDSGTIVQVGSALAYRAIPLQSAYCGTKHALQGFTESLRSELLHERSHVRVTMVHLPALNTPQFEWNRSRMPRAPQPVPPIFQPEVAADAIIWAADAHRREVLVGWPAIKAVLGNRIAPGYLDRYLGHVGYDAQQADEQVAVDRRDNLFTAVPRDYGAHGRFGRRARSFSLHFWLLKHGAALAAAATLGAASVWTLRRTR